MRRDERGRWGIRSGGARGNREWRADGKRCGVEGGCTHLNGTAGYNRNVSFKVF